MCICGSQCWAADCLCKCHRVNFGDGSYRDMIGREFIRLEGNWYIAENPRPLVLTDADMVAVYGKLTEDSELGNGAEACRICGGIVSDDNGNCVNCK